MQLVDEVSELKWTGAFHEELAIVKHPVGKVYTFYKHTFAEADGDDVVAPSDTPAGKPGRFILRMSAGGAGSSPLTTKGDLHTFSTADARLPVGADGEILTADSGQPTGLKWQAGGSYSPPIPESDVDGLVSDLAALSSDIAAEASARASADSAEAAARAAADALLVPKARVLTTTAPLKIAGTGSADLSADRTLSVDAATTSASGIVQLATPSSDVTAGHVVQANDARLSDARTPTAHATSHKNGGGDEVATATPGANEIPKADSGGKLAAGWGGAASTLATLNSSTKVVEDPANATATATASKIPIADGSGKLDTWVSDADATTKGKVKLAGDLGGTSASPTVKAITETSGPTSLVAGTIADGQFLKRVGSTLVSAAISTPASISEGAIGSRGAASSAGDLYLSSDHPLLYRADGSNWQGYKLSRRLKDPNLASFTWDNQESASVSTIGNTIKFTSPKAANDHINFYGKAVPASTPWNVDIAFIPHYPQSRNYLGFGLAFYKSSATTKFSGLVLGTANIDFGRIQESANLTSWNFATGGSSLNFKSLAHQNLVWMRAKDDGTNLAFYGSMDGVNWFLIHTETRATFVGTPDRVGVFGLHNDATYDCIASWCHWEES